VLARFLYIPPRGKESDEGSQTYVPDHLMETACEIHDEEKTEKRKNSSEIAAMTLNLTSSKTGT
jgi:hypothetical protein